MWRRIAVLGVIACAVLVLAGAALAATPQQIYRDYADNGRLDHKYSQADLQRAQRDAALQGYPRVGVQGAVEQALGAQAVKANGGLPFTGLDLATPGCRRRSAAGRRHGTAEARQGQEARYAGLTGTGARDGDATVDERRGAAGARAVRAGPAPRAAPSHRAPDARLGTWRASCSTRSCSQPRAQPRSSDPATPASSASRPSGSSPTRALVLGMLQLRGMYSWRFRVSVLDDLRGILAVTALGVDGSLEPPHPPSRRRGRPRSAVAATAGLQRGLPRRGPRGLRLGAAECPPPRRAGQADPDRRRGPRRQADGESSARAPRARPRASRLHRQGAAGRARAARARPGGELGSRTPDRAARDRARRRHLLHGAERSSAA